MKILAGKRVTGFLFGGLSLIAACQSGGHQDVEATSARLDSLKANIEMLKTQVSASAASLADVVSKADTDPKPAFDKYKSDAKTVESSYNTAASRVGSVRTEADKLFKAWEERTKTLTDPDLQKRSEERRANFSKMLDDVMNSTQKALDETKTFVATNTDLVKYLGQDLTPAGIKAVADKSKAQSKSASSIADKLDDADKVATKAAQDFATAKPPPPPPPAK
jgi:hypothetical protein